MSHYPGMHHGHAACAGMHALYGALSRGLRAEGCSVCVQWGWLQGISYLTYFRYTTSGMLRLQYTGRNDGCGLDVPSVPAMPPSQAGFAYPNNSTTMPPVPAHADPCQQVGVCCSVTHPEGCCHSTPAAAEAFQQDCTLKSHAWLSDLALK